MRLSRLYRNKIGSKYAQRPVLARRKKDKVTVASIAAYNADGKLLFGLRNDSEKWTLPGGHAEEGEDPRDAAVRELKEETGLDAGELEYLGDGYGGRDRTVHVFCYKTTVEGEPTVGQDPDDECSVWTWVDESEIPDIILDNLHNKRNITLDLLGLMDKKAAVNVVDEAIDDQIEMTQETTAPAGEEIHHPDSVTDSSFRFNAQSSFTMYHGSPYGGMTSFDQYVRPPVFFTEDKQVAMQYATGSVVGTQKNPGNGANTPTVYTVNITGVNPFDMRNEQHAELYESLRQGVSGLPSIHTEGFIMSGSGLPAFSYTRSLLRLLGGHGFDSIWIDEGSQGVSLALGNPSGKVHIVDAEPVGARTAGGFGVNLTELTEGLGGPSESVMSSEHNVGENTMEDPDLKLGAYDDGLGPLSDEVDDDKIYHVTRGASIKMSDLVKDKEAIALPGDGVDENKYEDDLSRTDNSIPLK